MEDNKINNNNIKLYTDNKNNKTYLLYNNTKNRQIKENIFRCCNKKCNAMLYLDDNFVYKHGNKDHICNQTEKKNIRDQVKKQLIGASQVNINPDLIISNIISNLDIEQKQLIYNYKYMKNIIINERKKTESIFEENLFNKEEFYTLDKNLFIHIIKEDYIIIFDNDIVNHISKSLFYIIDGTFKYAPSNYTQILTILIEVNYKIFPCIFIILKTKQYKLYREVFVDIKNLIKINKEAIWMSDYETGLIRAYKEIFEPLSVQLCYVHFMRAINNKLNSIGLMEDYNRNQIVRFYIKCIKRLPFLKYNDMLRGMEYIEKELLEKIDDEKIINKLKNYISYIKKVYLTNKNYKLENISIYNSCINFYPYTTNDAEGFHNGLNSLFKYHSPEISKIIKYFKSKVYIYNYQMKKISLEKILDDSRIITRKQKEIQLILEEYDNNRILKVLENIIMYLSNNNPIK